MPPTQPQTDLQNTTWPLRPDDAGPVSTLSKSGLARREFLWQSAAFGASSLLALPFASGATDDPEKSAIELMTPQTNRAIDLGLKFLASRQNEDGDFGLGGYSRNVAVCGLCGLAFMSAGSTPGRGRYGKNVDRCVKSLLNNVKTNGFITVGAERSHGPMYGHGFATLFLAQAYGMSRRKELRDKLSKAVKLIIRTQNREGGWRYQPKPLDADISVTVCQVMALRAARNTGLHVPNEVIDRCIEYVKKSQNNDGGFKYMTESGKHSAFPRSAAGVVALFSAGVYEGPEIEKGLKYLMAHVPSRKRVGRESHYFYGQYYAVQAMWQAGGQYWARWYPAIRDQLISMQRREGYWADAICREYGTAMACIILQMPNNSLPIFQR